MLYKYSPSHTEKKYYYVNNLKECYIFEIGKATALSNLVWSFTIVSHVSLEEGLSNNWGSSGKVFYIIIIFLKQ